MKKLKKSMSKDKGKSSKKLKKPKQPIQPPVEEFKDPKDPRYVDEIVEIKLGYAKAVSTRGLSLVGERKPAPEEDELVRTIKNINLTQSELAQMNDDLALSGYPKHEKSIFIVDSPWHIIAFLVNILLPGFGTILAGFVKGGPIKYNNLHVGISQFLTSFIFLFGWCWSIYTGYKIYRISRDHQLFVSEYESELDSEEDEEASPGKPKKKKSTKGKKKSTRAINESSRKLRSNRDR